jgi:protein TonB
MAARTPDTVLRAYELYIPSTTPLQRWLFPSVLFATMAGFLGAGAYFSTVKPLQAGLSETVSRIRAQFIIQEQKPVVKQKEPEPKKAAVKEKPIDLTEKPKLEQKADDVRPRTPEPKAKRIYGLKRVYSTGIGAGGMLSDAVVGKLGNTLNKEVDDLKATQEDIKGDVVSVTTITTPPRFRKRVKPEYTPEMLENRIEGVINVKVLVDIDGKVKKAQLLNDLGFGSDKQALDACYKIEFEPAMRGDQPVAVWIIVPIRFVLLG